MRSIIIIMMLFLCGYTAFAYAQSVAEKTTLPKEPPFSTPVTIEEVRKAYYLYSLPTIIRTLKNNNAANWNMILEKVVQGEYYWGHHLETLWFGANKEEKQEILVAFAKSIPTAPYIALGVVSLGMGPSILDICSAPFTEADNINIPEYITASIKALQDSQQKVLGRKKERGEDPIDSQGFEKTICIRLLQERLEQ